MPPLFGSILSSLGLSSRSGAAVSDDEASDFVVDEKVEAPTQRSTNKRSLKSKAPPKDLIEVKEVETENVEEIEDEDHAEDDEEEDDNDDTGEGEFVVETIKNHLISDGQIMYLVKWEGYEKHSDMTWEPEDNLLPSAEDILNAYLKSVGGREAILGAVDQENEPKSKKRGRASTTSVADHVPNGKKQRKQANHPASTTPPISIEKAAFKPPTGSWEDDVEGIDACEGTDGNVMVFLQWASGHKTQHPLEQVYKRCPQKMLKFYESHLSFTPAIHTSETPTDVPAASSKEGTKRSRGRPPKEKD